MDTRVGPEQQSAPVEPDPAGVVTQEDSRPTGPSRLVGLRGRVGRPFWGLLGIWAVVCGALASNPVQWEGESWIMLGMAILLADLAWGSVWDLVMGTEWGRLLRARKMSPNPGPGGVMVLARLPFTQRGSPAGRLLLWFDRQASWWRTAFWPEAGPALLGLGGAVLLGALLTLLLPARLWPLNGVLVILVALALAGRRWASFGLACQALVQVGLGWVVGYLAQGSTWQVTPLILALAFSVAAWGGLRMGDDPSSDGKRRGRGIWLLNGGQAIAALVLVWLRQPLAGGAIGSLLLGQVALQPGLRFGRTPAQAGRRSWVWLMVAMAVAVLGLAGVP